MDIDTIFIQKFFETVSEFIKLSPSGKEALQATLKKHELPKGHVLIRQETICNHLFLVHRFESCEKSNKMNTITWVLQLLIAGAFLYSGINKSIYSAQKLITIGQTGVEGLSPSLIRFIGIIEILVAIGVTLPWSSGVLPMITPLSAVGFAIIMILACRIHYKRKEYKNALNNILLLIICLFVAWYRFNSLTS